MSMVAVDVRAAYEFLLSSRTLLAFQPSLVTGQHPGFKGPYLVPRSSTVYSCGGSAGGTGEVSGVVAENLDFLFLLSPCEVWEMITLVPMGQSSF